MKIWILQTLDDGIAVHLTLEAAKAQFDRMVEASWQTWFGDRPMTAEPYEDLCKCAGFYDFLSLNEHYVGNHPAVSEARAVLHQCIRRLEVNDLEGEEVPFIQDCETALEMLG